MDRRTRIVVIVALVFGAAIPASADPQGYIEDELSVGYFYSTFDADPNLVLLAGGSVMDFCLDDPDDPFNAEPGSAPLRVFPKADGSTDLKADDKGQPIHLHEADQDAPVWIAQACDAFFDDGTLPEAIASGTADLKVRISIGSDAVEVFNSVNGFATGSSGEMFKVRASADLTVVDGVPVGDPADFVSLIVRQIR